MFLRKDGNAVIIRKAVGVEPLGVNQLLRREFVCENPHRHGHRTVSDRNRQRVLPRRQILRQIGFHLERLGLPDGNGQLPVIMERAKQIGVKPGRGAEIRLGIFTRIGRVMNRNADNDPRSCVRCERTGK